MQPGLYFIVLFPNLSRQTPIAAKACMMSLINRITLSEMWWSQNTSHYFKGVQFICGRPRDEWKKKCVRNQIGYGISVEKHIETYFVPPLLSYKLCSFYILIITVSELLSSESCILYDTAGPQSKMPGHDAPQRQLWITAYL